MSSTDTFSTPVAPSATSSTSSSISTPSSATTSPTTSSRTITSSSTSASSTTTSGGRRHRKSTLTQQQKNNKRQRATHDQLVTLEMEFNKNPTPTAAVRERIAEEINMTERSVQIWFQNRRAKIKMIAKKSIETGESCDSIPESMRQYLAQQLNLSKGGKDLLNRRSGGQTPSSTESSQSGKVVIHHFTCRSLSIGSWRRIGQNAMDLVIFYSPEKATMTYYINNDSAGYKIEYPFSHIKNISLDLGEMTPNGRPGGLVVELLRPPFFYMDSANTGGFIRCGDFTEDQQASRILVHYLGGHPKVLSMQLAKLVSLDAFQNRMAYNNNYPIEDQLSSPHSIDRPASQPNQLPMAQVAMYPDAQLGVAQLAQGHKRQRSRSLPTAVDFTYNQTAMPALQVQPQLPQLTTDLASVPQQEAAQGLVSPTSSYSADAGMYPMSATTSVTTMATTAGTTTVSDYTDSNLVDAARQTEPVSMVTNAATAQYSVPYVAQSPMVSQSPVSTVSPVESLMMDQSPPLSALPNTTMSSDLYPGDQPVGMTEGETISSGEYAKPPTLDQLSLGRALDGSNLDLSLHGLPDDYSPVTTVEFPGIVLPYHMLNPAST